MVFGLGILRGDETNNEAITQYLRTMILLINSQDKTYSEEILRYWLIAHCHVTLYVFTLKTMRYWLLAQIMFGSCGVCFTWPDTHGFGPWETESSHLISSASKTGTTISLIECRLLFMTVLYCIIFKGMWVYRMFVDTRPPP